MHVHDGVGQQARQPQGQKRHANGADSSNQQPWPCSTSGSPEAECAQADERCRCSEGAKGCDDESCGQERQQPHVRLENQKCCRSVVARRQWLDHCCLRGVHLSSQ